MNIRRLIGSILWTCLMAAGLVQPATASYIDPVNSPKLTGQRGSGASQVAGLSNGNVAELLNAGTSSPSVKVVTSDGTLVYTTSLAAALGARATNKMTMVLYPIANGELVVTVEGTSAGCDNNTNNPFMFLRLSATGTIATPFTSINVGTNDYNCYTNFAELSNGNLAFTYQTAGDSFSLRILQPNGTPVTGQTSIQKTGTGQGGCSNSSSYSSRIASNGAGQFLVAEHCYNDNNLYGVLYNNAGSQITVGGAQHFTLGTYANTPYQSVLGLSDGSFVVAYSPTGNGTDYQFKKVAADGTISSVGSFSGSWPSFKTLGDGGFMIFDSSVTSSGGYDYYYTTGARYSNAAVLLEPATKLDNAYTDRCWPDPNEGTWCDSYDDTSYFGAQLATGYSKGVLFPNGRTGDLWLHSFDNSSVAPAVTGQPGNASVPLGGNTSFSSTATGTGLAYQWQVDTGSGFANLSDGGLYSGATTATLSITGATLALNGYAYRVVVTGSVNPAATSNSATLTVSKKNSSTALATSGASLAQGVQVTLTATVTGSGTPTGTVTFLDGATTLGTGTLNGSGSATWSSSALSVGSHSITAQYGGDSSFNGSTSSSLTQTIFTVPSTPTIGTATAGDAQASVSFSAPGSNGGAAITGYTVTASPGGATGTGPASPITVSGLTNGTSYTFTMTATNAAGTGAASGTSSSVTPKGAQTLSFANPGAQNFGTTPTLSASASSGLTPSFSSSTTGVCTITAAGQLSFVAAGTCTVNADQAGNGNYLTAPTVTRSFAVNAVVPGAPTIGSATAGDTQASVSFSAPGSNGGSSVTGYTVTANPGGATATGAASPITVTGLTNGVSYTFTVTAANSAGTGSASAASNSVTPKAAQTITFNNPGAQGFGTTPTLSASASSGLTVSFSSATAGVCSITSGGALTFVAIGTCTINADQAGNGSFIAAPQLSRSFTVNKGSQSLSFTQPAAVSYGSAPLDLSPQVGAGASASPVSFSIVGGTGSGTLSGSNNKTLTVTGAGTIVLQADQAGDINFNAAAPVQRTLTVNQATLTVTAHAQTKAYGASDPTLSYGYSGLVGGDSAAVITGALSRAAGETVAGSPYAIGQGTLSAGANYQISFTGANLSITRALATITWLTPFPVPAGTTLDIRELNASANLPGSFSYTPAAGSVVNADQTLSVTFTPTDTANYQATTATVLLEVQKSAQNIGFAPLAAKVLGDAPFTLSASADSGLTVGYTSSDSSVATVSGNTVTVVGVGTTTITATQAGNGSWAAAAGVNQPLVVGYASTPPALSVSTLTGGSRTRNTTLNVSGNASSVNGIRSVIVNGTPVTLTGTAFSYAVLLAEGNNALTVTAIDRAGLETTDTRSLILDTTLPLVTVTSPADNSIQGTSALTLTGALDAAGSVQVALNGGAPQAATMSGNSFSIALTLAPGTNTIQVTGTDLAGNQSSISRSVVADPSGPSLAITAPAQDLSTDQGSITISGTVSDSFSTASVTVSVDGASYPQQVSSGSFSQQIELPVARQYAIAVSATDLAGNSTTVQRNVIRRSTPQITWATPAAITYGTQLSGSQLNATAGLPGSFSYTPPAGTLLAPGATQQLTVTFTPDDGAHYTTASASVSIDVNRVAQTIAFAALAPRQFGAAAFDLSATATSGLAVSFTSSDTGVATVSGDNVTIVGAGSCIISASQSGNASYAPAATVNQLLVVRYGTQAPQLNISALSDGAITHLNTVNLSGSVNSQNGIKTLLLNGAPVQLSGNSFSLAYLLSEGRNRLVLTAVDNAGLETTDSRSITLDTTAPVIAVDTPADNSMVSSRSLSFSGLLDNAGSVSAILNGGSPQQATMTGNAFEIILNLADGPNTVFLTATDLAGNSSTVKRTVVSDTSSPALAVTSPAADATVNATSVTIVGSVSDDLGVPQIAITLDGRTYTPPVTGGSFSQQLSLPTAKSYAITVRATDQAGNISTVQRNVLRPKMLGDLTRDGKVDIADALKALQIAVGIATADSDDLTVGDVAPLVSNLPQPDGVIDIEDALAILKKAIGSLNF